MLQLTPHFVEETLRNRFGQNILEVEYPYDFPTFTVALNSIREIIQFLYDEPDLKFRFLTTCCGMHFPDAPKKFAMVYHLHSLENNFRIRLKTYTDDESPHFPTLTDLFKTANWMEREAFDFFGFRFTGHNDMRRILNMDSLEGWPLRKEFPLEDPFRKDKDDKMFGR